MTEICLNLINSEPVFIKSSFSMPATASSVFRSMGYLCSRRDSDSSDDEFDLVRHEEAPDGLQWHLDDEQDQTGGSISGIEGLSVTSGGFSEPEGGDEEGVSPSPRVTSPRGISDPEGGSSDGGSSDDERLAVPLTPGGDRVLKGVKSLLWGLNFLTGVKVMSQ